MEITLETLRDLASVGSVLIAAMSLMYAMSKKEPNFTKEHENCLKELTIKMGILWQVFEAELPKALAKLTTPTLDALLMKAAEPPDFAGSLSEEEAKTLVSLLKEEHDRALGEEKNERAFFLAIYLDVVRLRRGWINPEQAVASLGVRLSCFSSS